MITIKEIKNIKNLSANKLPKIPRVIVCPDRKDWADGTKSFRKAIGKAFTHFHNVVYVLWVEDSIVYIGQSKMIINRLSSHKHKIAYTHVSLLNFIDSIMMDNVEIELIKKHCPMHNKAHNPNHKNPFFRRNQQRKKCTPNP
jgi:hypothetical protein